MYFTVFFYYCTPGLSVSVKKVRHYVDMDIALFDEFKNKK